MQAITCYVTEFKKLAIISFSFEVSSVLLCIVFRFQIFILTPLIFLQNHFKNYYNVVYMWRLFAVGGKAFKKYFSSMLFAGAHVASSVLRIFFIFVNK